MLSREGINEIATDCAKQGSELEAFLIKFTTICMFDFGKKDIGSSASLNSSSQPCKSCGVHAATLYDQAARSSHLGFTFVQKLADGCLFFLTLLHYFTEIDGGGAVSLCRYS